MPKDQPAAMRTAERGQQTRPVYLYHFNYEGTHYYFTNYDVAIVVNGGPGSKMSDPQTFISAQIAHSSVDDSMDTNPRAVAVALAANDAELKKYFFSASPKVIDVEVYRANSAAVPEIEYADDLRMVFRGIVNSISFDDEKVVAQCITRMAQEDRIVPCWNFQFTCNRMLYRSDCGVNKALFNVSTTIAALNRQSQYVDIASTSINVGSPSRSVTITNETFSGGYLVDAAGNKVGILASEVLPAAAGTRLWLNWVPATLAAAQSATFYCGCLKIKRTCHELFQNLPNFGGHPYIPTNNPAVDGINV